jgi:hypothetical protein
VADIVPVADTDCDEEQLCDGLPEPEPVRDCVSDAVRLCVCEVLCVLDRLCVCVPLWVCDFVRVPEGVLD